MVTATATPLTMAATKAVSQLAGLSPCGKITHRLLQSAPLRRVNVSHLSGTWEPDIQSLAEEKVAS